MLGIDVSEPPSISTEWEGADIRLQVLYRMAHLWVYGLLQVLVCGVMLGFYEMRDSVFGSCTLPSRRQERDGIHSYVTLYIYPHPPPLFYSLTTVPSLVNHSFTRFYLWCHCAPIHSLLSYLLSYAYSATLIHLHIYHQQCCILNPPFLLLWLL